MLYGKKSTRVDKAVEPNATGYYNMLCTVCGDSFKSSVPKGKYCSGRCSNDAYIARRRKQMAEKRAKASACSICATPITQTDSKIKAYCSNACKQRAYRMRNTDEG